MLANITLFVLDKTFSKICVDYSYVNHYCNCLSTKGLGRDSVEQFLNRITLTFKKAI